MTLSCESIECLLLTLITVFLSTYSLQITFLYHCLTLQHCCKSWASMELIWVRKIGMIHLKHFQENDFLKQGHNFSIKVSKLLKRVKLVLDLLSCSNFAGADELILSKTCVNTLDKLKTNAIQKKILCWTQLHV